MDKLEAGGRSNAPAATPTCTVAIPVYNRKDMIEATLNSVLSQPLPGLEVLVIDDCSTDGSWEILQAFHDSRLRLVRNEVNLGLFPNFNRCLELARGRYIRILGSDDHLVEGCLTRECAFMDANPNVAVLNCAATVVDAAGQPTGVCGDHFKEGVYPGELAIAGILWYRAQYIINPLSSLSGALLRLSLVREVGWFDTSMRMSGDLDLMLRMMEHGDLAVLRAEGAVIKIHPGAAGYQMRYTYQPFAELIATIQHYGGLLETVGLSTGVQRRMAAALAGYALVLLKKRQFGFSKELFLAAAAQPFVEWPHLAVGLARFVVLNFLRVVCGFRTLPPEVRRARRSLSFVARDGAGVAGAEVSQPF